MTYCRVFLSSKSSNEASITKRSYFTCLQKSSQTYPPIGRETLDGQKHLHIAPGCFEKAEQTLERIQIPIQSRYSKTKKEFY